MKYQYQQLVISVIIEAVDPDNTFKFAPDTAKINKWFGEWLPNLLVEDYDDLEFSYHSIGFYLTVPIKHIKPDIVDAIEPDNMRSDKRLNTLLALAGIKEDQFKINDCYLI